MSSVRVLVVDDHAGVRNMICSLLSQESTLDVIFQAANGEDAVKKADQLHPDLVLLDIGLEGMTGLETARLIPKVSPQTKIIYLSQHDSLHMANEALKIGGHGYVSKMDAGSELLKAIQTVREGNRFVSQRIRAQGSRAAVLPRRAWDHCNGISTRARDHDPSRTRTVRAGRGAPALPAPAQTALALAPSAARES
jgi:DNA-binding NarL/FixJ family response regulator